MLIFEVERKKNSNKNTLKTGKRSLKYCKSSVTLTHILSPFQIVSNILWLVKK